MELVLIEFTICICICVTEIITSPSKSVSVFMGAITVLHAEEHQDRMKINSERVSNLYLNLYEKVNSRHILICGVLFVIAQYKVNFRKPYSLQSAFATLLAAMVTW